jgi:23S rRNA (guanosine2251-2'-O)-methyltransferase
VHQGVVATAPAFAYADLDACSPAPTPRARHRCSSRWTSVTDPHNLGSIARTAEAVGAHGLVPSPAPRRSVTPVAEKAAAGALAHLPVVQVTNLVRTLGGADRHGVVAGTGRRTAGELDAGAAHRPADRWSSGPRGGVSRG